MVVHIITLYNKPTLIGDATESVGLQTRRDFVHTVMPDTYQDWNGRYPPAVFYNEQARATPLDGYVCWLSDDDVMSPNYVMDLAGYLDEHPEVDCVYGGSRHVIVQAGVPDKLYRILPQETPFPIFNADYLPGCKIDGGQFMVRRLALERVPYPYYSEAVEGARVCDARYMDKLVQYMAMYPVQTIVMTNRATVLSSHAVPDDHGGLVAVDWRRL